jgi:hypothetical protein
MEKLIVNNFAGLKSVELEIRPVLGLIGPQASGKSIIAKLLYFFRQICSRLPVEISHGQNSLQHNDSCRKRFIRYFPFEDTGQSKFEISYLNKNEDVRIRFANRKGAGNGELNLEWSDFYNSLFEKFSPQQKKLPKANDDTTAFAAGILDLREKIRSDINEALGPEALFEQIFIPAGRAFFSQVQSTVFTQLAEGESPDPFMSDFGAFLERSKSLLESSGSFNEGQNNELQSLLKEILRAQWRRDQGLDFLEFSDGRRINLAQASSGQQEALPLLLLLAQFLLFGRALGRTVYIEEPEGHLFPSSQRSIMELMARVFRSRKGKMHLVLTTHSPYILTAANNLIEAGSLYESASGKEIRRLREIIPKTGTFSPSEIGFYTLQNGTARSIVDQESGLIDANIIDQVSNNIAIQFDQLLSEVNEKS